MSANETAVITWASRVLAERSKKRKEPYTPPPGYWKTRPLDYITERLGVNPETIDWQLLHEYKKHGWDGSKNPLKSILDSLANNQWVGVESAKGVGKTFLGACIVLWFLECFENSLVVTTAPKEEQLSLHIWREISVLMPRFDKGKLLDLKLKMNPEGSWLAVGFVAGAGTAEQTAVRAHGFHAEHMLIILEETPGIREKVLKALIDTSTAPHNLILAFGNPDHQLDNLHKFCSMPNVKHIRISGFDHPNVVLNDPNFIPGAQSRIGLNRMLNQYGSKDSSLYLSRARGISPAQEIDSLIKIEWIQKAVQLWNDLLDVKGKLKLDEIEGSMSLGVDVANSESGDKAAVAKGKGRVLISVESFHCSDSNWLGKYVYRIMQDEHIENNSIQVDGIGVGAGTINTLKELGLDETEINFIGSAAPVDTGTEEKFNNLRSEAWWAAREDFRKGDIAIPNDEELISDLITPKWTTENGKIVVESKQTIKKRLGRSPNLGDAFVYWNWNRYKSQGMKMFVGRG